MNIKKFFQNKAYIKNFILVVIVPIFLNLFIEILNRASILGGVKYMFTSPIRFLASTMIIVAACSVCLIFRRRVFVVSIISAVFLLGGVTNAILQSVRVSPFNISDIAVLDSAVDLFDKYLDAKMVTYVSLGFIVVFAIILLLFFKGPRVDYKFNHWKNLSFSLITIVFTIVMFHILINFGVFSTTFNNLTNAYRDYGFVYSFGIGIIDKGVKKPEDYSKDKIESIVNKNDTAYSDIVLSKETNKPNIIFLQLESFFDIKSVKDIEFNENPIPYFNELQEKYSTGYLNVFNAGYGTCNTEFEIMTGMNLDDFGPGEIPFKSVLTSTTCESIAFNLKEYGYSTHAIHDNDATFYHRSTVFPNIGYDTFTSIEYMNIDEFTPTGWAKDKCLTSEIVDTLKSTEGKDYIYTISVQGHGNYPTTEVLSDDEKKIEIVSGVDDEGRKNAIEYYANEIHEMDDFIRDLTKALEDFSEDTILVMYGDHLPGLGFSENDLSNKSLYQTEYIIWNNFDMPKVDKDLETYQLAATVLKSLNMNSGVINRYHQSYLDDTDEDSKEYLSGLQNLEYDILYGDKIVYDGINPYTKTKIQMGIKDISIKSLNVKTKDDDTYVTVEGKNFNQHSKVYVNGKLQETEYIDENNLSIKYEPQVLDSFVVSQCDADSGFVISSTKECLYYGMDSETEESTEDKTKKETEKKTESSSEKTTE